ncbi:MAG: zinc dependent phospholipase C family protein [Eubacterium sp.]|nr:zinc dependent phospholipase C family protein [Eubacterium sp.]
MPAFATHYLFLDEIREELEKELDFKLDFEVAGVGTQGPDIFIFHRLWPPVTIYKSLFGTASVIHREKPAKLFEAFAEYLEKSDSSHVAKSYIYGFILHYALDRNCHPYVYAFQDKITSENKHIHSLAAHNQVEHAVDTYLLYNRKGIYPPSLFNPEKTFTSDEAKLNEIAELMHFVIKKCYDREVEKSEIVKAVTDTAKLQATLSDKKGNATRIAHAIERPLGPAIGWFKLSASIKPKDLDIAQQYANERHKEWTSPYSGVSSKESFEELFEKAKPDAIALLKGFNEICKGTKNGYDVTKNISFLTGLEVTE